MARADTQDTREILELVLRERRMAVSDREWRHRLRGYGYDIRETQDGRVVTCLSRGARLCDLPDHTAA